MTSQGESRRAWEIGENIREIREKINEAAVRCGRLPADITLVAAAKMNSAQDVRVAIAAGVDAVGENKVQELLGKHQEGAYEGKPLHFLGHLQTNKVRQVVGVCQLIESVDSAGLLLEIGKRATAKNLTQEVLLEVNVGREASKSGVLRENLPELLEIASRTPGVVVRGLMAIPPISGNLARKTNYFDEMYKLFVDITAKKYDNISMNFLSMGMSETYVEAIDAGATMVRIGSAIFGERRY